MFKYFNWILISVFVYKYAMATLKCQLVPTKTKWIKLVNYFYLTAMSHINEDLDGVIYCTHEDVGKPTHTHTHTHTL